MEVDLAPFRRAGPGGLVVNATFLLPAGPAAVATAPGGWTVRLAAPVRVSAELAGDPEGVDVSVAATPVLVIPCDRCLDDVRLPLEIAYEERWALQGRAGRRGAPVVPAPLLDDADGLVQRIITGDAASLDEGFWAAVAAELPLQVLCSASCRGLCPHCGANRNQTHCACTGARVDPRLAGLAQLLADPGSKGGDNGPS